MGSWDLYPRGHPKCHARLVAQLRLSATDPLASLAELGRAYRLAALDSRHVYGLHFGTLPPQVTLDDEDDKAAAATSSRQHSLAGLDLRRSVPACSPF